MSRQELAELRQTVIDKKRAAMRGRVSALEKKLLSAIFDKIIKELEVNDGRIVSNGKNIDLVSALDEIFRKFQSNDYTSVLRILVNDLGDIQNLNTRYFQVIEEDNKKIEKIAKDARASLKNKLGINEKGLPKNKGYLDRLIKDETFKKKVKKATYKAVSEGQPLEKVQASLRKLVVGAPGVNGGLESHFNTFVYDTYQYTDRFTSKMFAVKLGLEVFIYNGGKIKTTRPFCRERDGKVFTTDEAQRWKEVDFEGKPDPYDPLTDCGGYNCRHSIDFISKVEAIRRRPELAAFLNMVG